MVGDPQSKNPRQFNCREYIWETFEQMSQELDVTLDYLINESMRQYARGRERGGPMVEQPEQPERLSAGMGGFRPPMQGMGQPQRSGIPGMAQPQPMQQQPMQQQPMQQQPMQQRPGMPGQAAPRLPSMTGGGQMGQGQRPGMPTIQAMPQQQPQGRPGLPPTAQQQPMQRPSMQQAPQQQAPQHAPAPQRPPPPQARPATQSRTLIALFEGQQYPVTKEEFVIGRGQKTTDLTIRDSNVSRRHACVVLYNAQYWIVDQQSTNGIDHKGGKVDRKVIEDGDSYRICDHEIQFVYR
jgi:Inner membrane component of T3SS, cytoplasmic domain